MLSQPFEVKFAYGEHRVSISTGAIARQASGAVLVDMGGTQVLVTAVAARQPREGMDFLPLTVEFQERHYAGGRIPGSFFRREGRPTERETLSARLIDRPIRPLFAKDFRNEIQVIATVLSLNPEVDSDIPALLGASAALSLAGVPFDGPIGAARIGYADGQYLLNPSASRLRGGSLLDLTVAGTAQTVLMVESEAQELPESVMLGAVLFGHEHMQPAIRAIQELVRVAGRERWPASAPAAAVPPEALAPYASQLSAAYALIDKSVRGERLKTIRAEALQALTGDGSRWSEKQVAAALKMAERHLVRDRVLDGGSRIDGRDARTVRPLSMGVGVLPRTHGSALFTRGETQVIATATLGTGRAAQLVDSAGGESRDVFLLHYNFPPYCVGETGRLGTKRREVGHGRLAKRALAAVMPDLEKEFPYVVRLVSEVTESNGSSSMATVCGGCLALMDAGVPIKAPVAGIAMGLIKEGERFAVLTDILGDEDHLGDMDFKVAGTAQGITALQMDIKINGITGEIMREALDHAHTARLHILETMTRTLPAPRDEVANTAPRITTIKIHPERIRDVIGKGGATIRGITESTGASVDIDDDGTVRVAAVDKAAADAALRQIGLLTREINAGEIFDGEVVKLMEFGAFVSIAPGKDGLVHISQLAERRVERVEDVLAVGDAVRVKVLEVDRNGRIRLSIKALGEAIVDTAQ